MCKELGGAKYSGSGIVYKHDEYLNKSATIPSQRSVLLRKCNLDPITAPYGLIYTPLVKVGPTCGVHILVSYMSVGADLTRLDKSCINAMFPFNMTAPQQSVRKYFSTDDPYDGIYNTFE
ncbi:hypothetical protein L917_15819 [Phytophthora nicotianae]|uniref:Uncharacterized protein n=1 Tax=Phytophthora nicotianae TaxID=4792 RepID=W2KGG8_PHYNI|nr:hypothetical protein L917_15819 [Phytophthora nicotianae]